jgi:hypothetical protein
VLVRLSPTQFCPQSRRPAREQRVRLTRIGAEVLDERDTDRIDLLMSDLLRLTVSTFSEGQTGVADRVLGFVDRCLRKGDEDVARSCGA